MKKKIDATENPSRLENASARALSADRSEQASRPGTFSTMMSDRVIFSSASARIVAAEQVKGNKIAAMKPGADTSLASAASVAFPAPIRFSKASFMQVTESFGGF